MGWKGWVVTEHVFRMKPDTYEFDVSHPMTGELSIELDVHPEVFEWIEKNTQHIGPLLSILPRLKQPFDLFDPYEVIAIIPSCEDEVDEEAILMRCKFGM